MKVVQRDMSKGPRKAEDRAGVVISHPRAPAFIACGPFSVTSAGAEITGLPREFRCGGVSGTSFLPRTEVAATSMEDLALATRDPCREPCGLGLVFSFFTAEKAGRRLPLTMAKVHSKWHFSVALAVPVPKEGWSGLIPGWGSGWGPQGGASVLSLALVSSLK